MKKFDVSAAETEYVTTLISYRELAKKYNVSDRTISKWGSKLKWTEKRAEYQKKHSTKVQDKVSEKLAQKESDSLVKLAAATDEAINKVEYMLKRADQKTFKNIVGAMKDLLSIYTELVSLSESENENNGGIAILPDIVSDAEEYVVEE